jgi:hypothetical protein
MNSPIQTTAHHAVFAQLPAHFSYIARHLHTKPMTEHNVENDKLQSNANVILKKKNRRLRRNEAPNSKGKAVCGEQGTGVMELWIGEAVENALGI